MKKLLPFIMSGILALPTTVFAASSVRTLGGSGTYNGVTSASGGVATRAGSVRAVPSVRVGNSTATTTATTGTAPAATGNVGGGTRMSIGKYLSGSGVVTSNISTSTSGGGAINVPEFERKFQELSDKIDSFDDVGYVTAGDLDKFLTADDLGDFLTFSDLEGYVTADDLDGYEYLTADDVEAFGYIDNGTLQLALNDYLKSAALDDYAKSTELEAYAKKTDVLSQDNVAQIIAGAVTDPETGVLKDYATRTSVNQGFETVNGALTSVGEQITGINAKIDSLNTDVATLDVPECDSTDGTDCLYMLVDKPGTSGGESEKGWQMFSVTSEFIEPTK